MPTNVVPFQPYYVLGKLEEQMEHLTTYALSRSANEVLLSHVTRLRELLIELSESMERSRLEEQLSATLELIRRMRAQRSRDHGQPQL
jgi:hypothetical protein